MKPRDLVLLCPPVLVADKTAEVQRSLPLPCTSLKGVFRLLQRAHTLILYHLSTYLVTDSIPLYYRPQ